ncbi:unnamed protein product [Ilex paraguariensis]|uniref:F-box domain-containing protein n=1 Tax=Ilex paraguariensis TaxID=185542 RepID=A0ABC8QTY2_9AQUA
MEQKRIKSSGGSGSGSGSGGVRGGRGSGSVGVSELSHDLAIKVLTKLPAKSLMRFKCVSKLWFSTITDPHFSNDHRACSRSRSTFLMAYPDKDIDGDYFRFFYAVRGESVIRHQFSVSLSEYDGVTEVINGLFCLHANCRPFLCNISTHEIMELPIPGTTTCLTYDYYFGFHPTTKEYKLLHSGQGRVVETNTSSALESRSELYWIAFSLKHERFKVIQKPSETFKHCQFVQLGGHPALIGLGDQRFGLDGVFDIWIFKKDYERRSWWWMKRVIRIPSELTIDECCAPAANISTANNLSRTKDTRTTTPNDPTF